MSLGRQLGRLLGRRLRQVGESFAEGARQARVTYRSEVAAAAGRAAAAAEEPLDPKLAGFYANLELAAGADLKTVTRAWKRLVREYHPDRFAGDKEREAMATRLVQDLNHAYRELAAHLGSRESRPRGRRDPSRR